MNKPQKELNEFIDKLEEKWKENIIWESSLGVTYFWLGYWTALITIGILSYLI